MLKTTEVPETKKNPETGGLILERDYITPTLQAAVKKAMADEFEARDIINGLINAYMNMLVQMLGGKKAAARLLRDQADHLIKTDPISDAP